MPPHGAGARGRRQTSGHLATDRTGAQGGCWAALSSLGPEGPGRRGGRSRVEQIEGARCRSDAAQWSSSLCGDYAVRCPVVVLAVRGLRLYGLERGGGGGHQVVTRPRASRREGGTKGRSPRLRARIPPLPPLLRVPVSPSLPLQLEGEDHVPGHQARHAHVHHVPGHQARHAHGHGHGHGDAPFLGSARGAPDGLLLSAGWAPPFLPGWAPSMGARQCAFCPP